MEVKNGAHAEELARDWHRAALERQPGVTHESNVRRFLDFAKTQEGLAQFCRMRPSRYGSEAAGHDEAAAVLRRWAAEIQARTAPGMAEQIAHHRAALAAHRPGSSEFRRHVWALRLLMLDVDDDGNPC